MPVANHDKAVETAEVLLDEIRKTAQKYTSPETVRDLAEAYKLVVDSSPKVSSESSRVVRVR